MKTMRATLEILAKLWLGIFLLLSSIYCLLAFIPYTYFFLIKEPPYEWLIGFTRFHSALYWTAFAAALLAYWKKRNNTVIKTAWIVQAAIGVFLTVRNFVPTIQNNWTACAASLVILAPLLLMASADSFGSSLEETDSTAQQGRNQSQNNTTETRRDGEKQNQIQKSKLKGHGTEAQDTEKNKTKQKSARKFVQETKKFEISTTEGLVFSYSNAVLVAVATALVSIAATTRLGRLEYRLLLAPLSGLELGIYILAAYIWVALLVVSLMNLILLISARFINAPRRLRFAVAGSVVFTGLAFGSVRFLEDTLTFRSWAAYVFAVFFSAALTLWGFAVLKPLFEVKDRAAMKHRLILYSICIFLVIAALSIPTMIGENDWNGLLQSSFTLLFWILASICIYLLRPSPRRYSIAGVVAVLLIGGFSYWMLGATGFLWAKRLGRTDGEIARAIENYAAQDSSFGIAHYLLAGYKAEPCDEFCRTLRQYTNIHDARALVDLNLVDGLARTSQKRPNIFIFVIDSVRQDYMGAYNKRVDFTPNLDAFARDSIVVQNAYSEYAGTSLSEPAIWAGALLLHAHYLQPFARVNSLEKLAEVDGYRTIVSYDEVLRVILRDHPDLEKLDANKPWNELELSETLRQLESSLDNYPDAGRPILFYTQPKNVHQFARNHLPRPHADTWTKRPGFNNRIAFELHQVDEFLGSFFQYLKSRGLYENSVIVITSDHGEATGEFARQGHSSIICPEVIRVPLVIHLPEWMRNHVVYDPNSLAALTDIVPTLYYLLGHRPVKQNLLFGRPLLAENKEELQKYRRSELFLASDSRAAYGLLTENGNLLYTTYDSPAQSFLFDLSRDPNGTTNILNDIAQKRYQQRVLGYLQDITHFYEYKPTGGAVAEMKVR
jgi:glucan phosphoethanolaminetransferase (alkaline phosphatase superfamily)